MKLGELKSKIRGTKGSPTLKVELISGSTFELALMKGPLMEALDKAFPGGKSVETGLVMDDTGVICPTDGGSYGLKLTRAPLLDIMEAPAVETIDMMGVGTEKTAMALIKRQTGLLLDLDDEPPAPAEPAPKSTLLLDL